jgi:hypothetical protein
MPEDPLMRYTESFLFLRRTATPFDLVVSGEIKTPNTLLTVNETFSFVGSAYPIITLGDTSLEDSLQQGSAETADIVWLQAADGSYHRYFYSDGSGWLGAGWREVDAPPGSEDAEHGTVSINSGMIIQRRTAGAPHPVLLTPPEAYKNL